jgi:hypothetical protein
MGNDFKIVSRHDASAGFGLLRKPGEYLWSPSKRQLAEERRGKGWQLQQLRPALLQLEMASTVAQVVEISPGVHVGYPVEWLQARNRPEYIKVTLLDGSVVRYWQEAVESAVLDTSSGGCHVRMPLIGASLEEARGRQIASEQVLGTGADQPTNTDDELPDLVASDSESEEDARGSESSEGQSDHSEETKIVGQAQPLIEWRLMEEAFRRWTRYEYEETSVESDELPDLIRSDSSDFENDSDAGNGEQSAVGSVQGLSMDTDPDLRNWYGPCLPDVELIRTVFAAW